MTLIVRSLVPLVLALAGPAQAELDMPVPSLKMVTAGVVCPRDGGVIRGAPGTVDGEVVQREATAIVFDVQSQSVPAEIGLSFGFHLTSFGWPIPMTATVSHPAMGARNVTKQEWSLPIQLDQMVGYTFEDSWELLPGTWTFSVHAQNKTLFEADFVVTPTGTADKVQTVCFGQNLGS